MIPLFVLLVFNYQSELFEILSIQNYVHGYNDDDKTFATETAADLRNTADLKNIQQVSRITFELSMDETERIVMRECNEALVRDLDAKDVAPYLYSRKCLGVETMEEIFAHNRIRRDLCQKFLLSVVNFCPFSVFLDALRYGNQYDFLAQKLMETMTKFRDTSQTNQSDESTEGLRPRTETSASNPLEVRSNHSMLEAVARIKSRDSSHTRKLATLAHKLKTLSHNGDVDKFRKISDSVLKRFRHNKPDLNINVLLKMKEADVVFTVLEAEASAKRVKYDVSLYGSDIFKEMESVIPFTSNPTCSSMTYLARYGSALTMLETLDTGIAHLMYAKQHAQHIEPGKSTGMVYYIEVNLLSQKYEESPTSELKQRILKTAEEAISHFGYENEEIKLDYQRMLMLKMAFCYLGIGLFCRLIKDIPISVEDRNAAKACLEFIERPYVWTGMEKRRKMLFLVAKSEVYRQEKLPDLSLCHAKEAQKLAFEGGWNTELANIDILLKDINSPAPATQTEDEDDLVDLINDLLGDID